MIKKKYVQIKKQRLKDEKELAKQMRIEEKQRLKNQKQLAKQLRLEQKKRLKDEKELAKQMRLEEKQRLKNQKVSAKKKSKEAKELVKIKKTPLKNSIVKIDKNIFSSDFDILVKQINEKNKLKPYPDINHTPELIFMTKKINIALAGFGNIGSYFYKSIEKNKKTIAIKTGKIPVIKYISAKNLNKKRKFKIPKFKWVKNPLDLAKKKRY